MKHILVVDDEPTICELVAETLRDSGYSVETAANGAEALEQMRYRLPQAIVLDLMMPRLDGTAFIARMRLDAGLASIPILVVTASYRGDEAAERLGARASLNKPFELDELVAKVGDLVDQPEPPITAVSPLAAPSTLQPSLSAEV